jgi:hypothetical protein
MINKSSNKHLTLACEPEVEAPQPSPASLETKVSAGPGEKNLARRTAQLHKPLPEPPPKVGGSASAIAPSKLRVTGTINYNFPSDFQESSRDRVKSEEILAARDFNEKINSAHSERELRKLRRACAVRPVCAFCLEARQLHWGVSRIDRHMRDFVLLSAQRWAGLATDSEGRREFEESDEWKQYQDLLIEPAPVAGADGPAQPGPGTTNGGNGNGSTREPAARAEDPASTSLQETVSSLDPKPPAGGTTRRRGRRPNPERRDAIRNAISNHGDQWRDHLDEIFKELDRQEVPLRDFQGTKIDLGDGHTVKVSKWEDLELAEGEQRRQIVDVIRKYMD